MDIATLISHLAANAPGLNARLAAAGLSASRIRDEADLDALPVLRKDDLASLQSQDDPFGGFLACRVADLKRVYQSPGPIYEPEPQRADYWRWASALKAANFRPGDLVFNAFGYHLTPAGAMFEEGLWAVGCTVIPGGVGNQEQQVTALSTLRATGYVGLPSYLNSLLVKAQELRLEIFLEKAFVTAEPLPPSLRGHLNSMGISVRQGYGTAECGNLGFECEFENGWHVPEEVIMQICDINSGRPLPEGQTGEIVVTIRNPDYALVRFGTGDLSSLDNTPCRCERTTPRLMGWKGRVGDAVKVRGMFLHPNQLHDLMGRFSEVLEWRAIITRKEHKDYLTIETVLEPTVDEKDLIERLTQATREAVKFRPVVVVVSEETLSAEPQSIIDRRTWN